MAITNYLVHFKTNETFESNKDQLRNDAVAFVGDATIIHTHGTDYHCGSGPVALKSDLANYVTTSALTSGLSDYLPLSGGSMTGSLDMNGNWIFLSATGNAITANSGDIQIIHGSSSKTYDFGEDNLTVDGIAVSLDGHTHTASQVTDLATVATSGSYNDLSGKPSTFTPSAHTHVFDDLILTGAGDSSKYLAGNGQFYTINYSELAGKVPYNNLPVGTSARTVAAGDHEHDQYLTSSSLSGYAKESWVEDQGYLTSTDLNDYATTTDLDSYFLKTGGTISGAITVEGAITLIEGGVISCTGQKNLLWNDNIVLTEDNWGDYITVSSTDTKNTTGTSNVDAAKLYLVGGAEQSSTGVVTYSNSNVYTQSGQLYATRMYAIDGFYETSDARLKNFKDDIKALDVVSEIPTKYFTWKKEEVSENSDPKLHIGTSAQEIQKIYPDLVIENEEGELSVDYARLSVIALAAIKELKKEIDILKSDSVKYKF